MGTAVDTPLTGLAPTVQPIVGQISWPDGMTRELESVALLIDGQPALLEEPARVEVDLLTLRWDLRNVDAGTYGITIEVVDSLGKTAVSDEQLLTVLTQWPPPPTPTPLPTPTPTPEPSFTEALRNDIQEQVPLLGWLGGGLTILLGALTLPIILRRRSRKPKSRPTAPTQLNTDEADSDVLPDPFPPIQTDEIVGVLVPLTPSAPRLKLPL